MKTKIAALGILSAFLLTTCVVKSLHPFYHEQDVVYNKDLEGTWIDQDSTKWIISRYKISKSLFDPEVEDNSYRVEIYEEKDPVSVFIVHLFRIKEKLFFDFYPLSEQTLQDNIAGYHFIPGHSVATLKIFGTKNMVFNWFSEDRLDELFEQNKIKISHEIINTDESDISKQYILTASTDELQKFLLKYGEEMDIFKYLDEEKMNSINDSDSLNNLIKKEIENESDKGIIDNDLIMNLKKVSD